jgi:single-strand DNA-binding protein
MAAMNRVYLMGNLTRDPELRHTPSGTAVSDLGLAVSERFTDKSGEAVETVCFADVVVWGRQAEACREYLSKGSLVLVEGRLQLDQWETESGEKRSRLRVRAGRVQFLGQPKKREGREPAAAPAVAAESAAAGQDDPFPF